MAKQAFQFWGSLNLLGIVLAASVRVALAEAIPGATITAESYAAVAELLPPSVLTWVKDGDLTLTVGEMRDPVEWEPRFLQATRENAGRFDLDEEGGLIDAATRQRPPHTYGLPFPDIDSADPRAGVKVMWNTTVITFKVGRAHQPFALQWIGRYGFERVAKGHAFAIAFDYQPEVLPNPQRTEARDLFQALSPASIHGSSSLTWRYLDNREDSLWTYVPAIRRVRTLSAANRSDPAFGSDLVLDDGALWFGKNQSFDWKLIDAAEVLVGTVATSHVQLDRGRTWAGGQEWLSPTTYPGAQLGWETDGWSGAPWQWTNMVWVKRPVWIVEGDPKDPYYNYGRQLFYVDRTTFKIYYKVIYTPAGEYWKTILNDLGIATTTTDGEREVIFAGTLAVDDRSRHATFARGAAPDHMVEFNAAQADPELFTVPGLLRVGK